MAVLHLQVDIDREVVPELHELLASIGSDVAREERLRQLAAIGLIWERTRLRAQADIMDSAAVAAAVPATAGAAAPRRQLPVLTDVVSPTEFSGAGPAVALQVAADASLVGANDPVHDVPEARQRAHRSRLLRMKEKGLFKNE
jgi:hypothetical protein